jgi:two-component system LytT family sensor kinase
MSDIWIVKYVSHIPSLYNRLPLYFISTYVTLYLLIPRYVQTRRYGPLCGILMILAILYPAISAGLIKITAPEDYDKMSLYLLTKVSLWDGWGLAIATSASAGVIKLLKNWYVENVQYRYLQQQKISQEIQLLKSQLNGRFLVESLKNIQLLLQRQASGTPQLIMNLSELLSYTLYESDERAVLVRKEIELIKGYLALQRELNDGLSVQVTHEGAMDVNTICPLILLPLVESLFDRDAVSYKKLSSMCIDFYLGQFLLLVRVEVSNLGQFRQDHFRDNLHFKNVLGRLHKHYDANHRLDIEQGDHFCNIELEVNLLVTK